MKKYEYKGQLYNMKELSNISGVNYTTLVNRINKGYTVEEAVSDNPRVPESIREFDLHSDYHDWSGMVNEELYDNYKSWCIKNEFRPESNIHFTRSIKQLHPNIRLVPSRLKTPDGIKYKRVVRVDYYM